MVEKYEGGVPPSQLDKEEHVTVNGVDAKRVVASGYDGTNLQDLKVDSDGQLQIELTNDTIAGTAGTASADVITVQGIASMTPIQVESLVHEPYDYISLTYTSDDLTGVVFKSGGSGGTTVATLTLAYTDGKLVSVTRS